jgi:hypothetical protein
MKVLLSVCLFACAALTVARPALGIDQQTSAFLPAAGQTVHYRFTDSVTEAKKSKNVSGQLTLTANSGNEVHAVLAVNGEESRNFDFRIDQNGALQLASSPDPAATTSNKPNRRNQAEQFATQQALLLHFSLASSIGAHPGEAASFPALLDVPWASGPVNPILSITPNGSSAFIADGHDTTFVSPPSGERHVMRSVLVSLGVSVAVGAAAGAIGGPGGAALGAGVTATAAVVRSLRRSSAPLPTNVQVHVTGQLENGRLQAISGEEQYVLHAKKHTRTVTDKWTLAAESA